MNVGRAVAWIVLAVGGLVVVGAVAIWLFKALLSVAIYLIVGALVVGGAVYLYRRATRAIRGGTGPRRIKGPF